MRLTLPTAILTMILALGQALAQAGDGGDTSVTRKNECERQKLLAYNPIPGTIPLAYGHMPATDLVCDSEECGEGLREGDVLTSRQADAYYKLRHWETRCQWSLADLEPAVDHESAHIYKGGAVNEHRYADLDDEEELELGDMDNVDFVSEAWARLGNYRITVNKPNLWGMPVQYSVYLSKTAHNFLLRKALLRKLGYIVPPVKRVARLKINFPDEKTKKEFIKNISINNAGSFDRWVLSQDDEQVVVQDAVVMQDQEYNYNLAKGYLSEDVFQGKRIFDSLVIPFSLVEAPESINLMDWVVGRRYSDNIVLKFPHAKLYNCSRDDAVWMVRRILELTEQDWLDIVDATQLPASVKLLLFEKLKSRRNHLGFLFEVDNVNLPVNPQISNQDDLENGEILKEFYDGFARRFKIPDPESPLSNSEMTALFKSKAISQGMTLLVNTANSYLATDIGAKISDFHEKLADEVASSVTGGSSGKLPVETFVFPTVSGDLILNRDIVAGSFMGTDNLIQLVDTIGASVSAGAFGGVTGIYTKTGEEVASSDGLVRQYVPVDLNGGANLFLNRTYAHVKPITSVQKALKYPFRNIMVPSLKEFQADSFNALMDEFYQNLTPELKKERNARLYQSAQAMFEKIVYDHEKEENAFFARPLDDELQTLEQTLLDIKEDYEQAVAKEDISLLTPLSRALGAYYNEAKSLLKDEVLREGICLVKEVETDEEGRVLSEERCIQNEENLEITPENIRTHYPHMSSLLSNVDKLNEFHNMHLFELEGKEEEREIESALKTLNERLEVGESLIITDSFGANLSMGVGVNLYEVASVKFNAKAQKNVINRLHIWRASEDEIHVYKDLGNINSITLSTSVRKWIPIMKFTFKGSSGRGRTKFHKVPLGAKAGEHANVNRAEYMRALKSVMSSGSTHSLEKIKNPYVITHKFKEKETKFGIFVWRWNWLTQSDEIAITSPEGHTKEMYRRNRGKTSGRDFENYAKDMADLLVSKLMDSDFNVRSFNKGNPGYTWMGKAKNKIVTFEGIKDEEGKIPRPYVKVSRVHNGWKMDRDDALDLLEDIKEEYDFRFIEEEVLAQTEELFLYNINVNFFVYDTGIKHLADYDRSEAKEVFLYYSKRGRRHYQEREEALRDSGYYSYAHARRKYLQAIERDNTDDMAKYAMKMVEAVEKYLTMPGIGKMLGGGNNLFAVARVDGFRVGDPNGDQTLISNSFGRIGTEDLEGPMARIKKFLGISTGEFTMSWLLGRVI